MVVSGPGRRNRLRSVVPGVVAAGILMLETETVGIGAAGAKTEIVGNAVFLGGRGVLGGITVERAHSEVDWQLC